MTQRAMAGAGILMLLCSIVGAGTDVRVQADKTPAPAPRTGALMVYDAVLKEAVLYGGCCDQNQPYTDTWLWDGTSWTDATVAGAPAPQQPDNMVYDAARQVVTLVTKAGETWLWNEIGWTQAATDGGPGARGGTAMAYDTVHQSVVLFGGVSQSRPADQYNDTWLWDGTAWTSPMVADPPSPRSAARMTFDMLRGEAVMFGGVHCEGAALPTVCLGFSLTDTWVWDGDRWLQRQPLHEPSSLGGSAMTYDEALHAVVLFGGTSLMYVSSHDLWLWDGDDWQQASVSDPQPSERSGAAMAYDAAQQTIVLFGGQLRRLTAQALPIDPATWLWDGTAWQAH